MNSDLPRQLRARACQAGEPWTGDNPEEDHGHTDCWLMHQAADEIERLRALIVAWADADDAVMLDNYVPTLRVREQARDALRKAVGR